MESFRNEINEIAASCVIKEIATSCGLKPKRFGRGKGWWICRACPMWGAVITGPDVWAKKRRKLDVYLKEDACAALSRLQLQGK